MSALVDDDRQAVMNSAENVAIRSKFVAQDGLGVDEEVMPVSVVKGLGSAEERFEIDLDAPADNEDLGDAKENQGSQIPEEEEGEQSQEVDRFASEEAAEEEADVDNLTSPASPPVSVALPPFRPMLDYWTPKGEAPCSHFCLSDHVEASQTKQATILTTSIGIEGHEKVVSYNLKTLVSYTALFSLFSKGTILRMDFVILYYICLHFGLVALVVLGHNTGQEFQAAKLKELDTENVQKLRKQVQKFIPFCLALYVILSVDRWWILRCRALGAVFDAFSNVLMAVSVELRGNDWFPVRKQVAMYGLAAIDMIVMAARDEDNLEHVKSNGLITAAEMEELEVLSLWQRPVAVWTWIMHISVKAMDIAKTPGPRTVLIEQQCFLARDALGIIHAYVLTKLPFAYVHLITFFVNLHHLVAAIETGYFVTKYLAQDKYFGVCISVGSLVVMIIIYQGLLGISYMILDPFGDDVLDFPVRHYMRFVAANVDALLGAQDHCPALRLEKDLFMLSPEEERNAKKGGPKV